MMTKLHTWLVCYNGVYIADDAAVRCGGDGERERLYGGAREARHSAEHQISLEDDLQEFDPGLHQQQRHLYAGKILQRRSMTVWVWYKFCTDSDMVAAGQTCAAAAVV
jgi:hypothetical protein